MLSYLFVSIGTRSIKNGKTMRTSVMEQENITDQASKRKTKLIGDRTDCFLNKIHGETYLLRWFARAF
jgi:uncharacterized protein YajQ (UPF0234 family)